MVVINGWIIGFFLSVTSKMELSGLDVVKEVYVKI